MIEVGYSRYRQYYQRLEPILKKPHVRAYTMATLSFLALSFFGAFAIRPVAKEIFELNRKIEDRRLVNQKLDEKIKNLNLAQTEYKNIQSDLPLVLAALPQRSTFPPLLKNLEKMASISAISLTNLKFRDISLLEPEAQASSSASVKEFDFNLDASGFYLDLFSFFQALEKSRRMVNIGEVNLASGKATISSELKTNLKARVYFLNSKIIEGRELNE